jgi:hypothetical protein
VIVDQSVHRASPGPVWLRTGDHWKTQVEQLIDCAHSIVLTLPPGEDVRSGLNWEIGQIVRRCHQTRVTILLPPPDQDGYRQAFDNLCDVFTASVCDIDDNFAARNFLEGSRPRIVALLEELAHGSGSHFAEVARERIARELFPDIQAIVTTDTARQTP